MYVGEARGQGELLPPRQQLHRSAGQGTPAAGLSHARLTSERLHSLRGALASGPPAVVDYVINLDLMTQDVKSVKM